ncbi:MAG TPA: recombinase family protein [Thermoflexia bacterium]|jgi:site-specific DNA recombinase|nr:recombinase family protein [Thermoflexia bacterium]
MPRPKKKESVREERPLRAGLYARVSTEEQATEGHSIEAQLRIAREFAESKGWVVVREYTDPGYSGTTDQRPAFQRMIEDALAGEIEVIVFHKLDRFSRSISDILRYFNRLHDHGVLLASATEPFDFTTAGGKAHFHMLAVFAQWYIDNLSAETKKGKRQRVLKGLYNGRLPFGYTRSPDGVAKVVPEEAEVVRKAFEAYATGRYTDRQIAELMNKMGLPTRRGRRWSKDSVRDFLQNAFYTGKVKYKGELLPGRHEPIISEELFERCQAVRAAHRRAPRSHTPRFRTYMVSRLLRCARCGETLRAQSTRGYRYYREMSHTRGLECADAGLWVKAELVEEEVGAILRNLRLPEDWQEEIRESVLDADERRRLLERRRYLEGKLRRLGMAFADGTITEGDYVRERDAVRAELARLEVPEDVAVIDAGLYLETLRDLWDEATLEERRDICRLMLEAVYYDMREKRVVELVPKAPFLPLFRTVEVLEEGEIGRFRVLPAAREGMPEVVGRKRSG